MGMILIIPLPQMLQTMTVASATKASSQLDWQLEISTRGQDQADGDDDGPVTTGGKNFIILRMPNAVIRPLNST